jgi:hypothetical protein
MRFYRRMQINGQINVPAAFALGLTISHASPASAAPFQVPPIVSPASTEHHAGKPIFAELITPDIATAKRFYADLFGWTFTDVAGARAPYAQAYLNGAAVAGLVEKPVPAGEHKQSIWLNFFAAPQIDATAQAAVQGGAKVLAAAHDVPGRGREAVLADPQGAVFAILASGSGDPPDDLSPPGDWIWRSLITNDPAADANFYKSVLGDQVIALPATPGEQHFLIASENYARASINSRPAGRPNMHPHWLAYVRVDDAAKMAAKVTTLGGHVLAEPRPDRHGGMIAVVADPMGAPFGLMEWSDTENKQVTQ